MIRRATPDVVTRAGALLRRGQPVAFPTETVYGLGADATSDTAVARIFEIKKRPSFNPLIVHVTDFEAAAALADLNEAARMLAREFWPGPLSLVVRRRDRCPVSLLVSAGLDTIAVRVPEHPAALAILAAAGRPVAAPSANASGEVSPTRASHVADSLGEAVPLIVDDGPCSVGIESTVVDCRNGVPAILRPGGITTEAVAAVSGEVNVGAGGAPASPGMLASHYAPSRPLRLNVRSVRRGEALLSFGKHDLGSDAREENLSPGGDLREAAANLFAMLRTLDRPEHTAIAAMPIPETGLGIAVNDRLRRAARPPGSRSSRPRPE